MPGMSPGNMRSRISTMIHSEYIHYIYAMHHMNQFSSSFMYPLDMGFASWLGILKKNVFEQMGGRCHTKIF